MIHSPGGAAPRDGQRLRGRDDGAERLLEARHQDHGVPEQGKLVRNSLNDWTSAKGIHPLAACQQQVVPPTSHSDVQPVPIQSCCYRYYYDVERCLRTIWVRNSSSLPSFLLVESAIVAVGL